MHITTSSAHGAFGRLSIKAAFWCALVGVVVLSGAGHLFNPANTARCESLLNRGRWQDTARTQWQPEGCMLKGYDPKSTRQCLGDHARVVMIGDSIVRQIYYSTVKKLLPESSTEGDKHSDIVRHDPETGITFEFYWDPFINTTKTLDYLSQGKVPATITTTDPTTATDSEDKPLDQQEGESVQLQQQQDRPVPTIFLIGSGLWYLRYAEEVGNVDAWRLQMQETIRQLRGPMAPQLGERIFVSPIPAVNTERLNEDRARTLLPETIADMNAFLRHHTQDTSISVPFTWSLMTKTATNMTNDGLHYSEKVMTVEADILLNAVCNNRLPKTPPMAATCCYEYPKNTLNQALMLIFFMVWIPVGLYFQSYARQHKASSFFPSAGVLRAMAMMAGAVVFMYYSDRSALFGKGNKSYSTPTFTFLILATILGGYITLKTSDKDQPFLNRDQTDEWKGWMQIVILIYHYVGASKVSAIYNPVRMLVASYLFMTGYGHFVYFYKKADFGFVRVASILARLNLLTVLLTYTMNTTYLSYYFAPLVSFFYIIIYITMRIGHANNKKPWFILTKIVVAAGLTSAIIHTPVVLDTAFDFLRFFYNVEWDAREWRFRLGLDVWIVFVGMAFAYASLKFQESSITAHPQWPLVRTTTIVASVIGLVGYFAVESSMDKFDYNLKHPYISWIPILCFVVLRNSSQYLRNTTSTMYTFIGKCSLETFIGQFHMWLAGDTKGILIVSPWIDGELAWWVNLAISSLIFVVVSNEVSGATGQLSDWLVTGREPKVKPENKLPTTAPRPPPPASSLSSSQPAPSTPPALSISTKKSPANKDDIPLVAKRQSVMISPIQAAMGGVGDKAFDMALAAVQKQGSSPLAGSSGLSRTDVESVSPRSPIIGFQSLHSLSSPKSATAKDHSSSSPLLPSLQSGDDGYDDEAMRQKKGKEVVQKVGHSSSVALAIDTSSGNVSEHSHRQVDETERDLLSTLSSAPIVRPSLGAQFLTLWQEPVWKVGITLVVLWVLNFISS
ncbi:hypothetical protein BGW42_001076 [Actinomortierella wolfii]|nr:hypothetical protein BGW42_001076 [Actinomortierella wolfii]